MLDIKKCDHDPHVIMQLRINLGVVLRSKHGEIWQAFTKTFENSHDPTENMLKKVAAIVKLVSCSQLSYLAFNELNHKY